MIGPVNHIALAVPDLATARAMYRETLGAHVSVPQELPEHGVTVAFVELPNTKVELLEPFGENSPIARFLEANPAGGMHHICYEVSDLDVATKRLETDGLRTLGPARTGAHGNPVVFLHPKDAGGVLIELEEV